VQKSEIKRGQWTAARGQFQKASVSTRPYKQGISDTFWGRSNGIRDALSFEKCSLEIKRNQRNQTPDGAQSCTTVIAATEGGKDVSLW
jgi:hypothetical protein